MARMKSDASQDEQIEKAQERLEKVKAQYDSAAADLRNLLEERDSRRQKRLWQQLRKVTNLLRTYFDSSKANRPAKTAEFPVAPAHFS